LAESTAWKAVAEWFRYDTNSSANERLSGEIAEEEEKADMDCSWMGERVSE
jgi:hypothetical protein